MKRLVAAALFLGACSAAHDLFHPPDGEGGSGPDGPRIPTDGTGSDAQVVPVDGATPWTWQTLITDPSYEIDGCVPQGSTTSCAMPSYSTACAQVAISDLIAAHGGGSDLWIDGFRPGSNGVTDLASDYQSDVPTDDHRFLIVSTGGCGGSQISYKWSAGDDIVYAAGLGSNAELALPQGTAVHLKPTDAHGNPQYLLIFDRLVNYYKTTAMYGSSQVEAHFVDGPTTGLQEVDMVLGGTAQINATPGQTTMAGGVCTPIATAGYQWNIFAVWPHMHASGTHSTVSILRADGVTTQTLYDSNYTYKSEQTYVLGAPVALQANDTLQVDCDIDSQVNTLQYDEVKPEQDFARTVCWTGLYKYPPGTDTMSSGTVAGPEACVTGSPYVYSNP